MWQCKPQRYFVAVGLCKVLTVIILSYGEKPKNNKLGRSLDDLCYPFSLPTPYLYNSLFFVLHCLSCLYLPALFQMLLQSLEYHIISIYYYLFTMPPSTAPRNITKQKKKDKKPDLKSQSEKLTIKTKRISKKVHSN
jgi:hypothetical protein